MHYLDYSDGKLPAIGIKWNPHTKILLSNSNNNNISDYTVTESKAYLQAPERQRLTPADND